MQFPQILSLSLVTTVSPFPLVHKYKICEENSLYLTPVNEWSFMLTVCICIIFSGLNGLSDANYAVGPP